jgi:hypothetical protein
MLYYSTKIPGKQSRVTDEKKFHFHVFVSSSKPQNISISLTKPELFTADKSNQIIQLEKKRIVRYNALGFDVSSVKLKFNTERGKLKAEISPPKVFTYAVQKRKFSLRRTFSDGALVCVIDNEFSFVVCTQDLLKDWKAGDCVFRCHHQKASVVNALTVRETGEIEIWVV